MGSLYAVVFVACAIFVAVVLMVLAGRARRAREGTFDAESLAFVGGVLNALFIAVAAFYIVIAWQNADTTEQRASTEAAELVDLYWRAGTLPEPQRDQIRSHARDYAEEVAESEWPLMAAGREDPLVTETTGELRTAVAAIEPTAAVRQALERNLRVVTDSRRERLAQAADTDQLMLMLLVGTLAGGLVMVLFPVLMGLSAGLRHVVATALLTGALAATAFVAVELDHPFHGLIQVGPDAFHSALAEMSAIR